MLVDIAIMALSPAVNDPNTAVQIVDELTFLLPEMANMDMGPGGMADDDDVLRLVVNARTLGDYIDLATEQIVLYGTGDPQVRRSLRRLVSVMGSLELDGTDAAAVDRLAERLDPDRPGAA